MAGGFNQMMQIGAGAAAGGNRPSVRNPLMVLLIPMGVIFGSVILMIILNFIHYLLGTLMLLGVLAGSGLALFWFVQMVLELKSFLGPSDELNNNWWWMFVPCLGLYWILVPLPAAVTRAKQMAGVGREARSPVLYLFLAMYALAADLNEVANPQLAAQQGF
jgi:hypothetical protein